jgi:hypothetical protein
MQTQHQIKEEQKDVVLDSIHQSFCQEINGLPFVEKNDEQHFLIPLKEFPYT